MALEYRHNNGFDSVILVQDGVVRSDWTVDASVMKDFCDCTQDAADWDDRFGDEHKPEEYGELLAVRDGHSLLVTDDRFAERVTHVVH